MDIIIVGNIISNFSLVTLVVFLHYVVKERVHSPSGSMSNALLGVGFAVAAVLSILMGIPVANGVIFDTKTMLAVLAGFYGGWLPGLILAIGAVGARLFVGGVGAFGGSLGVLLSVGAGLLLRRQRGASRCRCRLPLLITLGLSAALIQIFMVLTLLLYVGPGQMFQAMSGIAAPTLLLYPPLTVLIGLMFGFVDDRAQAHQQLREAQAELEELNDSLAERVAEGTGELLLKNQELLQVISDLERTRDELDSSQKMAALGQLMAGIAHELNSPLGAVAGATRVFRETLAVRVPEVVALCGELSASETSAMLGLLQRALQAPPLEDSLRSRRERRAATEAIAQALEARHRWAAELVSEYRLLDCSDDLREILDSKHSEKILDTITAFGTAMRSAVVVSLGADKAAQTVQALHNYAHSNHSTEPERISLATEIDVVLELLHSGMHRRISIVRNYTEDIFIHGMRDPLNQVWMNLIKNALHAMQYRGTLTLTIERAVTPGVVCVAISDTGNGIPEHIRSHLFEPYVTTKEDGEGIGIGLDICKQIIERHDGSIEFETHTNGTTFSVFLPTVGSGSGSGSGTGGIDAVGTERNHKPSELSSTHVPAHNYGDRT